MDNTKNCIQHSSAKHVSLPKRPKVKPCKIDQIGLIIRKNVKQFRRNDKIYCALYYFDRVFGGLSASFLPITAVLYSKLIIPLVTILGIVVVIEQVFNPLKRWELFSKAVIRIEREDLKPYQDENCRYEEQFRIVCETKDAIFKDLVTMDRMMNRIRHFVSEINKFLENTKK